MYSPHAPRIAFARLGPVTTTTRILVVDDEETVRRVACRILGAAGYETVEAEDGAAALALVEQSAAAPDVVLSDVNMPRMNGTELERKLHERWPTLPVVLMSGRATREVFRRGAADQPKPILTKPFSHERLIEAIRGAVRHRPLQ